MGSEMCIRDRYRAVDNLTKEMVAIKKYKNCSDQLKSIKVGMDK